MAETKFSPNQIDTVALAADTDMQAGLSGATSLNELNDTTIAGPLDGEVLTYNNANSQWENTTHVAGVTDHLLLTNIGNNTHVDIDTHIAGTALNHIATVISYDDTNTGLAPPGSPSTPVDNVQLAIEQLNFKRRFKNTVNTGIITGGLISSSGSTTFSVTDGNGAILDPALNPTNAIGIAVSWTGQTGITLTTDPSGSGSTFIFINSTGTVSQFITRPANSVYVQNIFLGIVYYETLAITSVFSSPDVIDSTALNFGDYVDFHRDSNHKGIIPLAIGSGDPNSILEFYVTSGDVFRTGINWHNDIYNPNVIQYAANGTDTTGAIPWNLGATFDYYLSDGTLWASAQSVLLEDRYDDGTSTPGVLPNGDGAGQIQFIIKMADGRIVVQFYTKTYRDGKAAAQSVNSALSDLVLAPPITSGVVIGAYAGQEGENSWERGDRNSITVIGATGGGGGSSTTDASYFIDLTVLANVVTENSIPGGWTTASTGTGIITITHNLNDLQPGFALSVLDAATFGNVVQATAITNNTIAIQITDAAGTARDGQIVGKLLF